jgi:ATP-dependent DNA ligase
MPGEQLPLRPPIEPMLARPAEGSWLDRFEDAAFEPKWDGFRCLVFRTGTEVIIQGRGRSRSNDETVDLAYAFPELIGPIRSAVPPETVLDAEIVVQHDGRLDFGALSSRLRPRSEAGGASITRLAERLPATLLAFDLLAAGVSIMPQPFLQRRQQLEALATGWLDPLRLTPSTLDQATAADWFHRYEAAGVDGLIVKPLADPYQPGKRTQWKIKHQRTADTVVAGWRSKPAKDGSEVVASLLLGLHDEQGLLHYVGGTAAFTDQMRRELAAMLDPLQIGPGQDHPWISPRGNRVPGGGNRWSSGKAWHPLVPSLVAEVSYDQLEGSRFRHPAGFIRWRPDRGPDSCGFGQFPVPIPTPIGELLDWAAP